MGPSRPLPSIAGVQRAKQLTHLAPPAGRWQRATLSGRLTELSGEGASATLTLAFDLVVDAQHDHEPCAWITTSQSAFYPPDAAERGVDLESLVVVRTPHTRSLGRAADHLARSGAFGLILIDLGSVQPWALGPARQGIDPLPMPLQSRLLGLAQTHDIAIVLLTRKPAGTASVSSLVSLRAQAQRLPRPDGSHVCEAHVLKDKRRAPGWTHLEVCRGPAGLR